MNFKQFVEQRINYYLLHFSKQKVLLNFNGQQKQEIDLSFDVLSDEYLTYVEEHDNNTQNNNSIIIGTYDTAFVKITDIYLSAFLDSLHPMYNLSFNIEHQDIGDETILKLSQLYTQGKCSFTKLKLGQNSRITAIGIGKLGQSLQSFNNIQQIDLHNLNIEEGGINRIIQLLSVTNLRKLDLGLIGNNNLIYLAQILQGSHNLQALSFDPKNKWEKQGKLKFQKSIRRSESCKQITSINIYADQLIKHYQMISEFNIICKKNRSLKVQQRQNQFKAASLNPQHVKYYQPDNHNLNAYKFSVKSYLNNVFGSLLDQALYFLQKQRRNSLRQQAIFNITQQPINKIIMQDICTADGSIIVLTKYLLNKIKQNKKQNK